ncbi:MAG: DUF222 domain-containing protein [Actinomycetota bacterium]
MFEITLTRVPAVPAVDERAPIPALSTATQDAEFLAWLWASDRGYDEPGEATEAVEQSIGELTGPALASYLEALPPLAGVDGWTVVETIKGYEKLERYASARKLRAIAELAARHPDPRRKWARDATPQPGAPRTAADEPLGTVFEQASTEVALALDLPRVTARGLVLDAVSLTRRLPAALDALARGAISTAKARCVADETTLLSADDARRVAGAVLARPHLRTAAQTRAALRALVIAADPALARRRELNARSERFVRPGRQVDDGMVSWEAHLPVGDSVAIWQRLCGLADAADTPDDPRRVDARRADAFVDLLLGRTVSTIDGRPVQQSAGKVWRTDVVVAAPTLAGADEQPGMVVGFGPVTAQTARELAVGTASSGGPGKSRRGEMAGDLARDLAGDAQWRRILTDPESGLVRDYGTTRYRPPQSLADYVRTRDGRCIEPFCRISAWHCDLDHLRNSPAGPSPDPDPDGSTSDLNLASQCRAGHLAKSLPGWSVDCPDEGRFVWTTPTGHQYERLPEPPLPPPF